MNKQREVIYGFRNEIINSDDVRDRLMDIMEEVVISKVEQFTKGDYDANEWQTRALADWVNLNFPLGMPEEEIVKAAKAGKRIAGGRFGVRRLERGAVRGVQFHQRQHPQGVRTEDQF
jgi:preprotein translocase subunit SecA